MPDPQYHAHSGPFVGCPNDADAYRRLLEAEFNRLPHPGRRRRLYHWRKSYEPFGAPATIADQHRIVRASAAGVGPVFILFSETLGTPAPRPVEGWGELRNFLDTHGFGFISLLGEELNGEVSFSKIESPPPGTVPLTGTLYELFDALRSAIEASLETTALYLFHIDTPRDPSPSTDLARQYQWLDRVLTAVKAHRSVRVIGTGEDDPAKVEEAFCRAARETLRQHFGLGRLDPLQDRLPGLEALTDDSLLFGREDDMIALEQRLLQNGERCTLVIGSSGAGKSSLLRAGLLGEWFAQARSVGYAEQLTVILLEPLLLAGGTRERAPNVETDPLIAFADCLAGRFEACETGDVLVRPEPFQVVHSAPPLTGDRPADLSAALKWWGILSEEAQGRVVLILDQAEQIDALARRAARERAELEGRAEIGEVELSEGWWRLTALLALLGGVTDRQSIDPATVAEAEQIVAERPVSCVLGLHRHGALALWPLEASAHARGAFDHDVHPLERHDEFLAVVRGTCAEYGLELEEALAVRMASEAAHLARIVSPVGAPTGTLVYHQTSSASVLPQLVTALQQTLAAWRDLHGKLIRKNGVIKPEWRRLDIDRYGECARVEGAIERLGNEMWKCWRELLAMERGLLPDGYFSARTLEEVQQARLGTLLQQLVDAGYKGQNELAYLPRNGRLANARKALIGEMRQKRMLVTVGASYYRLPHRSVLENWSRTCTWLESVRDQFALKSELRQRFQNSMSIEFAATDGDDAEEDRWWSARLESLASLSIEWIGSGEGDDEKIREWLRAKLLAIFNSTAARSRSPLTLVNWFRAIRLTKNAHLNKTRSQARKLLRRLTIDALQSSENVWAGQLIEIALLHDSADKVRKELLFICAGQGDHDRVRMLLGDDLELARRRANVSIEDIGATPLFLAAQSGHLETVAALLEHGSDPDFCHANGPSALLLAVQKGHTAVVRSLLEYGADTNHVDKLTGGFALSFAAQYGHAEIIELLLSHGADRDLTDLRSGTFALLMAAQEGHAAIVESLLADGADPDRLNKVNGAFPLFLSARRGHTDVVSILLNSGADPNAVDPIDGSFALLEAAQNGHAAIVDLLLDCVDNPEQFNEKSGDFPLIVAADREHDSVVHLLLARGADPNRCDSSSGAFPLLMAAQIGRSESVQSLLEHKADPLLVHEKTGNTALTLAAQNGYTEVVEILLKNGTNPSQTNNIDGSFPLLVAAEQGYADIVKLLLFYEVDPNQKNDIDGYFALLSAALRGHVEVVAALLEADADPEKTHRESGIFPLVFAAQFGHVEVVEALLSAGADPDQIVVEEGSFALLIAAQEGYVGIVEMLLAKGAQTNREHQKSGTFPLLQAARNGHAQVVNKLIQTGAIIEKTNSQTGSMPLLGAAENGNTAVVDLLLSVGASPNNINHKTKNFSLLLAANNGHAEVVKALLSAGAEIEKTHDTSGAFPLLGAAASGHHETVSVLLAAGADRERCNGISGHFPLIAAAQNRHSETVKILLEVGVSPETTCTNSGLFALVLAAENGNYNTVKSLLAAGANPNRVHEQSGAFALLMAAQGGKTEIVKLLLSAGADPHQTNRENGLFSLALSAQFGHVDIVKALLAAGADPDQLHEPSGAFALLTAAANGHADIISFLVTAGALVDRAQAASGLRPLAAAIGEEHADAARVLLRAGASKNNLTPEELGQLASLMKTNSDVELPDHLHKITDFPQFGVPGTWRKIDLDQNSELALQSVLATANIAPDAFRQVIELSQLVQSLHPRLLLHRLRFSIEHEFRTFALELFYLDAIATGFEPLLLHAGLDLNAVLHDYRSRGILLELHDPVPSFIFTSLLLLTAQPPRLPVPGDARLISEIEESDDQPRCDEQWEWRRWGLRHRVEGRYVQLPLVEGRKLVKVRVHLPVDGFGAHILSETELPYEMHNLQQLPQTFGVNSTFEGLWLLDEL